MQHWYLREQLADAFMAGFFSDTINHEVSTDYLNELRQKANDWADKRLAALIAGGATQF